MSKLSVQKVFEKHGDEIISLRKNGMQMKEIGEKFNLKTQTVSSFLRRNNIRVRGSKNEETENKIIQLYKDGTSMREIASNFHFTQGTVRDILVDHNIHIKTNSESHRIYDINENYFNQIDTPNKAYILGLLYADGNRSSRSNTISIRLQESDKNILENIKKELNAEVPLRFIDYSNDPKRQNQFLLAISNEQIAKDLYKYGIVPRKEFKLTFPNWLDNDLLSHFIRGYLDGDGFISNNPKEKRANITGTENLLLGIKNILEDQLNIHFSIYSPHNKDTNTRTLAVAGGNQVKKFLDYIYEDADLYIERKYDRYYNMYCA